MKTFSKVAIAAALLGSAGGLAMSAPAQAQAQPKGGEQKQPGLKLSPDVLKAAQVAQPALQAKDLVTAEPAVAQAEAAATTEDDRYISATLRLVLESQKIANARAANQPADETRLTAPYDALLANPKTPPADLQNYAFERGLIAYKAKQYPQALTFFERARQLGSNDPRLANQIIQTKINAGDTTGGMAELDRVITQTTASGGKADEQLYRFAIGKSMQAKDTAATLDWMKKYIAAYPTAKNWRDMIKIYGLQQGSLATTTNTQKVDLYRLMRATNSLADQYDYQDYAQKTLDIGLPYETKTVIAQGRSSGKIPVGAGPVTTLATTADRAIATDASLSTLETRAKSAADGKLAAQTGDAQLGSGNYTKAVELYRLALQKGGTNADEVNTRLGIALAMSGDREAAKTAFAQVQGAPRAGIASLWTTYLNTPTA